jgi:Uma2 family endonuclease
MTSTPPYQETLQGSVVTRCGPGLRHEEICIRLHRCVHAAVANFSSTRLLLPRAAVRLSPDTVVCPDLALVTLATGKLWLAAEIISPEDHAPDTVVKKLIYEELRLPRLWMVDPRYDNVEVYHASAYGLVLKDILAGHEILCEKALPEFEITVAALFGNEEQTTNGMGK